MHRNGVVEDEGARRLFRSADLTVHPLHPVEQHLAEGSRAAGNWHALHRQQKRLQPDRAAGGRRGLHGRRRERGHARRPLSSALAYICRAVVSATTLASYARAVLTISAICPAWSTAG